MTFSVTSNQKPPVVQVTRDDRGTLFLPDEAAELLRVSVETLRKWRQEGGGPAYVKYRRRVRYPKAALEAWLSARVFHSTTRPYEVAAAPFAA